MHCPYCRHADSRVLDSRVAEDGSSIRRRRECKDCGRRFTTLEQMQLVVLKRSGVVEPFSREKVIAGVRKACKGRPVTEAQLAKLGQQVEESIRASGQAEVPAEQVGVAILGPLSELDPVAYLRFASVYRNYDSVDDFETEMRLRNFAGGQGWGVGGLGREGSAPITITVEAGAIVLTLGEGVDPDAARSAFDSAGDEIASALLTALQRR